MQFDPNNHVVKLCADGMALEGQGEPQQAAELFNQAWQQAQTDLEKFTAAHYVARHQKNTADKLKWDETALTIALKINDDEIKGTLPSLYLNIAKGYEDLNNNALALNNYHLAMDFTQYLPNDGYGNMIRQGVKNGIERLGNNLK
ncbi:hypothetical protein [Mucilaginibacter sp.]|uniref:hypothetical protein n=1 Tax=Mucilaginibacter sp. TaxID=1882438 RepID=UPI0035BC4616